MNSHSNEIPDIERTKQQHRALAILRFLTREQGSISNELIISARLDAIGLVSTREQLTDCLNQLEANGLTAQSAVEKLVVVTLTIKGEEVAQGRSEIEGVIKPSIDCPY